VSHDVGDKAKCVSRAACIHSRFQRSQPSIIHQTSRMGSCTFDAPSFLCALGSSESRFEPRTLVWNSTVEKFCRQVFGFIPNPVFSNKKSVTLRCPIGLVGWLVVCNLVRLYGIYGFWFLDCHNYGTTLSTLPSLHQERIHVVRSNKVARTRPARRHSHNEPRTHECYFVVVCVCV